MLQTQSICTRQSSISDQTGRTAGNGRFPGSLTLSLGAGNLIINVTFVPKDNSSPHSGTIS